MIWNWNWNKSTEDPYTESIIKNQDTELVNTKWSHGGIMDSGSD